MRRAVRMDQQVDTGPLYDQTVQAMGRYRQTAARMGRARPATQGKLDRQLERLGEQIGELLSQLNDVERMALNFWRESIMPDTYEIDHDAIMALPYESIRRVERITEEYDVDERRAEARAAAADENNGNGDRTRLKAFLAQLNKRL